MLYYIHKLINTKKATHMDTTETEAVSFDDILSLATWNRDRSTEELRSFINRKEEALDVEDFSFA